MSTPLVVLPKSSKALFLLQVLNLFKKTLCGPRSSTVCNSLSCDGNSVSYRAGRVSTSLDGDTRNTKKLHITVVANHDGIVLARSGGEHLETVFEKISNIVFQGERSLQVTPDQIVAYGKLMHCIKFNLADAVLFPSYDTDEE